MFSLSYSQKSIEDEEENEEEEDYGSPRLSSVAK